MLLITTPSAYPISSALARGADDLESSASVLGEATLLSW